MIRGKRKSSTEIIDEMDKKEEYFGKLKKIREGRKIKLKSDKEYAEIDKMDRKREKKLLNSSRKMFKEFDKNNKYWIGFIKAMPEEIQAQIMMASPFASTAVMLWISVGDAKTRDMKSQLIKNWENQRKKQNENKD